MFPKMYRNRFGIAWATVANACFLFIIENPCRVVVSYIYDMVLGLFFQNRPEKARKSKRSTVYTRLTAAPYVDLIYVVTVDTDLRLR